MDSYTCACGGVYSLDELDLVRGIVSESISGSEESDSILAAGEARRLVYNYSCPRCGQLLETVKGALF